MDDQSYGSEASDIGTVSDIASEAGDPANSMVTDAEDADRYVHHTNIISLGEDTSIHMLILPM